MSSTKRPRYAEICGRLFPLGFSPKLFMEAIDYKPTSSDIFVATYPKCGTTRMIQIVLLILRKGELPTAAHDYLSSCPFLEMLGPSVIGDMPGPGCLKTHLPFELVPFSAKAKYIYVARHPRDCVVSFYHHTKFFPAYYFTNGSFEDYFDTFLNGEVDFGDYFDHLLSWYKQRDQPNILFITFEEISADHRGLILKVAEFLGRQYVDMLEEDEQLLEAIVKKSSFEYMWNNANSMWDEMIAHPWVLMKEPNMCEGVRFWAEVTANALDAGERSVGRFVRSGQGNKSGKIRLNDEQERRLNKRIREKTKDSDVMDLWK